MFSIDAELPARRHDLGLDGIAPSALTPSVAVVTGGSRGIGRMTACALAGAGAAVAVLARSHDDLHETVAEIEREGGTAMAAIADVLDPASMAAALDRVWRAFGSVDLLVNNAGVLGPIGPLWEVDAADWWHTMEVNLRGVLTCSQAVLPKMVARRRGRIVNIASQAGVHRWPLVSAYSVSKAALVKLTENLAHETARFGVGVFSVHPGLLPIGMSETALPDDQEADAYATHIKAWVAHEIAVGRGGDPRRAMRLLVRIARGDADALSGRHVSVHDDLDDLLARIDVVREHDLYVMRPERFEPEPGAPVDGEVAA